MAQVGNTAESLGGEYMIQDRDHMVEIDQPAGATAAGKANRGRARQSEQSGSQTRQQGEDQSSDRRRQNH